MAALTDLTLAQLEAQLPLGSITVVAGKATLDLGLASGQVLDAMTDAGVIKLFAKLHQGCYDAQQEANTNQIAGERLAAFRPPVNGDTVNGYVPTTRALITRSELSSATNVVGQVA